MSRRYQKVQEFLPQIKQMLEQRMSQREVAESIGLKGERPALARDDGGAAPGFRGTRLWNQSLVCYTFVQQTAAAWGSSALLFR